MAIGLARSRSPAVRSTVAFVNMPSGPHSGKPIHDRPGFARCIDCKPDCRVSSGRNSALAPDQLAQRGVIGCW